MAIIPANKTIVEYFKDRTWIKTRSSVFNTLEKISEYIIFENENDIIQHKDNEYIEFSQYLINNIFCNKKMNTYILSKNNWEYPLAYTYGLQLLSKNSQERSRNKFNNFSDQNKYVIRECTGYYSVIQEKRKIVFIYNQAQDYETFNWNEKLDKLIKGDEEERLLLAFTRLLSDGGIAVACYYDSKTHNKWIVNGFTEKDNTICMIAYHKLREVVRQYQRIIQLEENDMIFDEALLNINDLLAKKKRRGTKKKKRRK